MSNLPADSLCYVTTFLDSNEIFPSLPLVCSHWNDAIKSGLVYRTLYLRIQQKRLRTCEREYNLRTLNLSKNEIEDHPKNFEEYDEELAYHLRRKTKSQIRQQTYKIQQELLSTKQVRDWRKVLSKTLIGIQMRRLKSDIMHELQSLYELKNCTIVRKVTGQVEKIYSLIESCTAEIQPQVANLLRKPIDGFGNTLLHAFLNILKMLRRSERNLSYLLTLQMITFLIDKSRQGEHTCLTVLNNMNESPMHMLIKMKRWDIATRIVEMYAKDLAKASFCLPKMKEHTSKRRKVQFVEEDLIDLPILGHMHERIGVKFGMTKIQLGQQKDWQNRRNSYFSRRKQFLIKKPKPFNILNLSLLYSAPFSFIKTLHDNQACNLRLLVNESCAQSGNYPLHFLIYSSMMRRDNNAKDKLRYLTEYGASVQVQSSDGFTPMGFLSYCSEALGRTYNFISLAEILIAAGRREGVEVLNDTVPLILWNDIDVGVFEVCLMRWSYSDSSFEWFIKYGADFNRKSKHTGKTPLMRLVDFPDTTNVGQKFAFVVKNGGSKYSKLTGGSTTLHYLCQNYRIDSERYDMKDALRLYFECNQYHLQDRNDNGNTPKDCYRCNLERNAYELGRELKFYVRYYSVFN
jgi:hypothetical protein